jgi:hypothetical protein
VKLTGDGSFDIDDETLDALGTLVQLPFSPTMMERKLEDLFVPLIRMIQDELFQITVAPRILIDDTQDIADDPITYNDYVDAGTFDVSTDVPLCYFILLNKDFTLDLNEYILPANYAEMQDILNKTKKLLLPFDLKMQDVFRFDHSTPVFLDQFSAYFYVNKIMDFKKGSLTFVELIRI